MNTSYRIDAPAFDGFDVGVARFDIDGRLTYANAHAARLLGTPGGTGVSVADLLPDESAYRHVLEEMGKRREGIASRYRSEIRPIGAPDEFRVPVSVYAFPELDEDGRIVGSISLIRDLRRELLREDLHRTIESSQDNDTLLASLDEQLRPQLNYDLMRVAMVSKSRRHTRTLYATPVAAARRGFRWWILPSDMLPILERKKPFVRSVDELQVEWATLIPRYPELRAYLDSGMRQSLSVPIVRNNLVLGWVSFDCWRDGGFGEDSIKLVGRLPIVEAGLAALHREDQTRQAAISTLLTQLGHLAGDVQAVCVGLVERLQGAFNWQLVRLHRIEATGDRLMHLHSAGPVAASLEGGPEPARLEAEQGDDPRAQLASTRGDSWDDRCVHVVDLNRAGAWARRYVEAGLQSLLVARLGGPQLSWILEVASTEATAFSTEEIEAIQLVASEASPILHQAGLFQRQCAVLGAIGDAVVEVDQSGRIRWCNPAAERLLGVGRSHFGSAVTALAKDAAGVNLLTRKVAAGPDEVTLKRFTDGADVPALVTVAPLEGQADGRAIVVTDYAAQKEVVRLREMREVFRHAAMEGRVPLALAIGGLEDVAAAAGEERSDDFDKIRRQLSRADLPLERLMRLFASPPSGVGAVPVEMADLLARTIDGLPREQIELLAHQPPSQPLWVRSDFRDLQFCVESMLSFALRTRPRDRHVQASAVAAGERAVIQIGGDWDLPQAQPPAPGDGRETTWRSKALADFALGQEVLAGIAQAYGGCFEAETAPALRLALSLPIA